jgi:DNA (cytosine-5)-methyltransferase 1
MSYAYYNEIDAFCCNVLRKNIDRGYLPGGKVDERDIREVHARDFVGYQHIHLFAGVGGFPLGMACANYPSSIRTITGGFPCTDISNAGRRAGIEGEQSGLWKEMYRIIKETIDMYMGPDIILLENVAALVNRGLSTVLGDLAQIGLDARWQCLRASDFGAPHQRERIFIVAYPNGNRLRIWQDQQEQFSECPREAYIGIDGKERSLADASSSGRQKCNMPAIASNTRHSTKLNVENSASSRCEEQQNPSGIYNQPVTSSPRQSQSRVCREPDGISAGLDRHHRWPARPGEPQHNWEPPRCVIGKQPDRAKRLKALGNAIVPQCVEYVVRCVLATLESEKAI